MGVLLSFFFFCFRHSNSGSLRRVRNLGAIKGSNWQRSAPRKEDAREREREGALQSLRMP